MNTKTLIRILKCSIFGAGILLSPSLAEAQTSSIVPMGAFRVTINAGSVEIPVTSAFAISLLDVPAASGAMVGRINALTAATITATGANWATGALAMASFPYAFQITSGAAAGATFSITANTTDTLTTSGVDLTTLGLTTGSTGDTFRLIPIDTLNTLFGSSTFLGGTSSAGADIITLASSLQLSYYYNTSVGHWVRTTGPTTDHGNTPIPLNGMISVTRKSSAMTLTLVGRVPDVRFSVVVPNSGSTYTHTGFPTDVSLGTLSLQTALPGWVSAPAAANADTLWVNSGAIWLTYFYNGSYWQRTTGPATNHNSVIVNAGTPILIFKSGTATGSSTFIRNVPYSL